ncbi:hypothetical protein Poly24_33180 [Rosistilla carotiformis]|uniref:Uncharacterized protein n=1 Tax=Rosistilla carotiformis TaxID=2528017 RepID=A0A518JVN2_9BACT|nr:hypothetical protein [Rosistilla carotiformis]QDV69602.1 hypothetical protein Poly24_33180 [Rosistilla carotiformis]
MSSDVKSVDALRSLHTAVLRLSDECDDHATQLRQLAHRFREQITVERRQYWQSQLQLAERRMQMAHEAMARAKISHDTADGTRNTEAEIMLARCKKRVGYCLDKLKVCKRIAAEVDRVVDRFIGELGAMTELSENGLPQSANRLAAWIDALDIYTDQSGSPSTGS